MLALIVLTGTTHIAKLIAPNALVKPPRFMRSDFKRIVMFDEGLRVGFVGLQTGSRLWVEASTTLN